MQSNQLLEAIKTGNLEKVKETIEADPSLAYATTKSGATLLLFALYNGQREIADYIAGRKKLDIHEASSLGRLAEVRNLVQENPRLVGSVSQEGFAPLGLAAYLGQNEVIKYLLENSADVNFVALGTGFTALTGAVSNGHREAVQLLLSKGADVNHRYEGGFSPLMTAAESGSVEIAKLLIAKGAEIDAKTNDGKTPLSLALERGQKQLAEFLLQHGAK